VRGIYRIIDLVFIIPLILTACVGNNGTIPTTFSTHELLSHSSSPTQIPDKFPKSSTEPIVVSPPPIFPTPSTIPIVMSPPPRFPIFGLELSHITADRGLDIVAEASTTWVRLNGVLWSEIEPSEGTRNWQVLTGLEQALINAAQKGLKVILVVRSTPPWAQQAPGSSCGPIKEDKLNSFANFVSDLVSRYSLEPYSVEYWELWNEPDAPVILSQTIPYGCWGNPGDTYYGGSYYTEMLKVAYPAIKAADPNAQVLVGGLLLDCDPTNPPVGNDCKSSKFLEGILANGGGLYFDGVSFHAFDYYYGSLGQYGNPNWYSAWNITGPAFVNKACFLHNVLKEYGYSEKYLMNTETAILCTNLGNEAACQADDFALTKAYYVVISYSEALALGIHANVWYSLTGWRASGLIANNLQILPAYESYRFVASQLGGATFVSEIDNHIGVKGYEFFKDGEKIWVLWSLDGNLHFIQLPSQPDSIRDVFGEFLPLNPELEITIAPTYLTWTP
jgi:hypothetical protein